MIHFSFAFAVVALLWMVTAQPLNPIQHTALMGVYVGLGSFLRAHATILCEICFFFFLQDATQPHVLVSRHRQIALDQQHVVAAMSYDCVFCVEWQ
jgi:hypothetical protein